MLPADQLRLLICLAISIPLSYVMGCMQSPTKILALTCISSMSLQAITFQEQAPLLWLQQNIVYFMGKMCNRDKVGKYVLMETFTALIAIQVRRMYISYGIEHVDVTVIFMMQTFLYISFAYNYQDGSEGKGSPRHTVRTIDNYPEYSEYMGYVLFLPSCLVGPVFEFNDFEDYLHRRGVFRDIKAGFALPGVLKEFKVLVLVTAVYFILVPLKLSYMLTAEFADRNFGYKFIYLLVSIVGVRFKYYSVWSLGMVAMNATGFTYNPQQVNGRIVNNWDRVVVSDIWTFQMDPSMKRKADRWNIPIQLALKRYIYNRLYVPSESHSHNQRKKLQIMAQQKTLAVSALWHGLYPGYFVSFFHWGLILQVSQELFRIQRNSPTIAYWRKKLHYVQLVLINYILAYFGCCFIFMTWEKIMIFFSATHFIPVAVAYLLNLFVVRLGVFSRRRRSYKGRVEGGGQNIKANDYNQSLKVSDENLKTGSSSSEPVVQSLMFLDMLLIVVGKSKGSLLGSITQTLGRFVVALYFTEPGTQPTKFIFMVLIWSFADGIRYLYYLLKDPISALLRYNIFLILYPVGAYAQIQVINNYIKRHAAELSIDQISYIRIVQVLIIIGTMILYSHMLKVRKRYYYADNKTIKEPKQERRSKSPKGKRD